MEGGDAVASEDALCGFVCVCVQKSVEFDIVDQKLHRATKDRELHEELEKLSSISPSQYAYQLGGGCRVMGTGTAQHPLYVAAWGESVAAFEGTLANLEELAKSFPTSHTVTTATVSSTPDSASTTADGRAPAALAADPADSGSAPRGSNPAELVCLMYDVMGQDLLGLLKGKFSLCLYHGKTGRVLAARDGSGAIPLFQGLSPAQSLVISSRKVFTGSCEEVKQFEPGYFKYGWYAEPRKFGPMAASHFNHHGRQSEHTSWHRGSGSARTSMDQPRSSRSSVDQSSRAARGNMDQPRVGRASMDQPRTPAQGQAAAGGRPSRAHTDKDHDSAQRRSSLEASHAPGAVGQAKGQSQAQAGSGAAEAAGDGWTAVGQNRRKSIDAAGRGAPSSARQGQRRSMDVKAAQSSGADKALKTPPRAPLPKPAAAAAVPAADTASGTFKFDVNAPAFKPVAC